MLNKNSCCRFLHSLRSVEMTYKVERTHNVEMTYKVERTHNVEMTYKVKRHIRSKGHLIMSIGKTEQVLKQMRKSGANLSKNP